MTVRKSLALRHHIISMLDGKPYRSLKCHLSTNGRTPADYRERLGLKLDYPMVAPGYSDALREVPKRLGLDRKSRAFQPEQAPPAPRRAAKPGELDDEAADE